MSSQQAAVILATAMSSRAPAVLEASPGAVAAAVGASVGAPEGALPCAAESAWAFPEGLWSVSTCSSDFLRG